MTKKLVTRESHVTKTVDFDDSETLSCCDFELDQLQKEESQILQKRPDHDQNIT